ncbi:unnamed protein product [Amaranthus hypochondriacus]
MLLDRLNTTTKGISKQPSSPNAKDHPRQPSTPSKTRDNTRSHDNDVVKPSFEKPSRPKSPPPPHRIPNDSIPSPPFFPPEISQPLSPPNPRDSAPPMLRSSNVLSSSPSSKSTSSSSPSASQIKTIGIVVGAMGGFIGLVLVSLLLYLLRGNKSRKPTGLSGQLQRAFVTGDDRSDGLSSDKPSFVEGLPNLKRSELVTACEDFSNVIGTSSIGAIYKGTLSNGVEIAVISLAITSAKDWSRNLETQFRKKVEILSKVNHKNFVNLIGYCEEEQPFTRLMVFEYAPNGSLFEHLYIKEAEHLDWRMRLRVAMGLAYCLEYMHQLTPPVTHPNLKSSAVSLSEDYAAQLSDFCIWNEVVAPRLQPMTNCVSTLSTTSISPESNVYSFGLVLLEMMTGRIPQSIDKNSLDDWVSEYMSGEKSLQDLVDPMLHSNTEQLDKLSDIIRKCLHSEQNRPTMRDVTVKMKEVTGINQDKAAPRFSSLWWAELDVRSLNGT